MKGDGLDGWNQVLCRNDVALRINNKIFKIQGAVAKQACESGPRLNFPT